MPWPRFAAWAIVPLTAAVLIAAVAAVVASGDVWAVIGATSDRPSLAGIELAFVVAMTAASVVASWLGLLVARRRPANVVAPLMCWMGLLAALVMLSDTYTPAQVLRPDLLPALPSAVSAVLMVTWVWLYVAALLLLLFFPDGELPGPRWRLAPIALVLVAVGVHLVVLVTPGAYDPPYQQVPHALGELPDGVAAAVKGVLFPLFVVLFVPPVAAAIRRFRRGDLRRRAQLKWFALASLAFPLTIVLSWGGYWLLGTHSLAGIGIALLYLGLPVAAAIAILRHDLYDVDRALSATITYGVLSAGLLLVFGVAAFGSGLVFGGRSVVAAAAITAVTALVLAPLRSRLQKRVDRRLYPMRRATLEAIDGLRKRTHEGQSQPEELEAELRRALHDPALRVGYLLPGAELLVDASGQPIDAVGSLAIQLGGRRVGALVSAGPASRELLREVADAAALLVEVVRLRLEVSQALREVEASRARLLSVGYQERRRLERDLHDGAQQRLVSLGMALRLAQRHLDDPATNVDGVLDTAVAELGTAVAELRQVAHGLRPSSLDDGLGPALAALSTTTPIPLEVDVAAPDELADDVATTAYFVASEAVTNAVKHADAEHIRLQVGSQNGELRVRVSDDGQGGATTRPGAGLSGLADRVAALGGRLQVHSPRGNGTIIEAVLPCAS